MTTRRVMIVEDEAIVAEDLRMCLGQMGYEVVGVADSAGAAERLAQTSSPELALLDIRIKGSRDGIELAAWLQEQRIGFVYLTSHADETTLGRARNTEPLGYVLKPFHARELHPVLEMAFHRHAAEQRLRSMENWLATTLRSIGDAVIVTDASRRVSYLNPAAERVTGWKLSDALGIPSADVLRLVQDVSHEALDDVVARAMMGEATVYLEPGVELVRRDGTRIPVDDTAAPIKDADGCVTGAVVVIQDATQRLRQLQEQGEVQERLEEARRLHGLGVLAGGLAHDLNNILTTILGEVGLAQDDATGPLRDRLDEIESQAMTAGSLCRSLLSGAGAGPVERVAVAVAEVAQACLGRVRKLAPHGIALEVLSEAHGLRVLANPTHLHQVLQNLLQNAVEALAGRSGTVVVRLGTTRLPSRAPGAAGFELELPPGDYVWIEVADDGPGMADAVLRRIFDPFFTTKVHGRGLGLASVRGIVRRNGAAITAVSEEGHGTVFRLLWPAAPRGDVHAQP